MNKMISMWTDKDEAVTAATDHQVEMSPLQIIVEILPTVMRIATASDLTTMVPGWIVRCTDAKNDERGSYWL